MADSSAVSSSTAARQNVSPGAKSALLRAKSVLQGYSAEDPRIAALIEKLGAIESPQDDGGVELAKTYEVCQRLAKSESAEVRKMAADASFELQRAHLQRHSGGYTHWRDSAVKAGRIRD
jgi:hypothetical protein